MSYSGTVRCGHCYSQGHNKRGCPKLKEEIATNPNGWEAQHGAGKARQCSYCQGEGHNRASCSDRKTHESAFRRDNKLWRQAFDKWAVSQGLGYGALLRAPITWRNTKDERMDGESTPALGMFTGLRRQDEDDPLTREWARTGAYQQRGALWMDLIGANLGYNDRAQTSHLQLPDIPVIAPAHGKDSWGYERSRDGGDSRWTVVSPSPVPGFGDEFTSVAAMTALVKDYFKTGKYANTASDWNELTKETRQALKDYLNDSATLEELGKRLNPEEDENSEGDNQ